jgi:TRAP-type C4-dicarboxylate transport system permease small subunit
MASHGPSSVERTKSDNRFVRAVQNISSIAGWCSALMILAAVFLTCQMIFIRFVLNGSTVWQTEYVVFLVIAATLIGLPFVQFQRGHVNVDLIPLALRGKARFALAFTTLTLSIGITSIMLFYGYEHWHFAWASGWTSDTVTAVPLWIPYLSLPLGFGLLLLQLIADLVALVTKSETPFGLEAS